MYKKMLLDKLKDQKKALQIPFESIAKRSNLGPATIKRAFAGKEVSFTTIEKIAIALECEIHITPKTTPKNLYKTQVEKKAKEIVGRVLQTSALESQSVDTKAQQKMLAQAKAMILKMPKSQVWE
jgi:transcriptional regulator with XRE-family HTH domain